jgi:hypothetical protein
MPTTNPAHRSAQQQANGSMPFRSDSNLSSSRNNVPAGRNSSNQKIILMNDKSSNGNAITSLLVEIAVMIIKNSE